MDDLLKQLQEWFKEKKITVELPFKVSIGKVEMKEKGWVSVKYTDITGKTVTFAESPSISVATTEAKGWIKKPEIKIPKLKVEIKPPKVELKGIPPVEFKIHLPKIPQVKAPDIPKPKMPRIEAVQITNRYCFTYRGKTYCYPTLEKYYKKAVLIIGRGELKRKFGDWGAFNWIRDAWINVSTAVGAALLGLIGRLEDWRRGNEIRAELQKTMDKAVEKINNTLSSFTDSIYKSLNDGLKSATDTINKELIDKWNAQMEELQTALVELVSNFNKWADETQKTLQDSFNKAIQDTADTIEDGLNKALEISREKIEESVEKFIDALWKLIGLAEGVVFQPAVIRNVTNTGFEVYSTGKGTTLYFIAVGR